MEKLVFGALVALFVATAASGCSPSNGSDSGMPDTDSGILPPGDGGHDVDAYIPPGTDAGPDTRDSGGGDTDAAMGRVCMPLDNDYLCLMGGPYDTCACDPRALGPDTCLLYPEMCSGSPPRNTCSPRTMNHCGLNLPPDMPSYTPFVGGSTAWDHLAGAEWNIGGTTFGTEIYFSNGQQTLGIPMTMPYPDMPTGWTMSGDWTWWNWSNMNHPTRGVHCVLAFTPDYTTVEMRCWDTGVDPRPSMTCDAPHPCSASFPTIRGGFNRRL